MVKWFQRKDEPTAEGIHVDPTVARRAARMNSPDLLLLADTTVSECGRWIDEWRKNGVPEALMEARISATALVGLIDELEARQ